MGLPIRYDGATPLSFYLKGAKETDGSEKTNSEYGTE